MGTCWNCETEVTLKEDQTNCDNCGKQFPKGTKHCSTCPPYKKGKNFGEPRKLKERLTNKDTCQVYRGSFKKKDGST